MLEFSWPKFIFSVVNFLILAGLLTKFLHKPLMAALDRHRKDIEDARQQAEDKTQEAEAARAEHERAIGAIQEERDKVLAEARHKAEADGEALLAKAREQAEAEAANLKRDWERQRRDALDALQNEIADVSLGLAGRVLHELSDQDLDARLTWQLDRELQELAAKGETTRAALFEGDAPVKVVSAKPMLEERRALSERIQALGKGAVAVVFETDESLIAGARVEFSSLAIDATVAGVLAAARESFQEADDEASAPEAEGEAREA